MSEQLTRQERRRLMRDQAKVCGRQPYVAATPGGAADLCHVPPARRAG
jgi:hypothetical protein